MSIELQQKADKLRNEVIKVLQYQGYTLKENSFFLSSTDRNAKISAHEISRAERISKKIKFINSFSETAKKSMINSSDIEIEKIKPKLIEIKSGTIHADFFRWWNLTWWSLPYEKAYGRQMRFIIWDEYHDAPIGLIGLQSPILSWKVRDSHLGITQEKRDIFVNQSMNAQRLGSLPPYNKFLGGKLIALLMTSDTVRDSFYNKYKDYETILLKRKIPANLLFITTTGAYGKSSVYNRLRFKNNKVCDFIGYTHGSGSFHIPNSLYEGFVNYLMENNIKTERAFGNGPSVKMRIISQSMNLLGFKNGNNHGIKRALYLFPFAKNLTDIIQNGKEPDWQCRSTEDLTQYWKHRWAVKRTENYPSEKLYFSKEEFIKYTMEDLEKCKKLIESI